MGKARQATNASPNPDTFASLPTTTHSNGSGSENCRLATSTAIVGEQEVQLIISQSLRDMNDMDPHERPPENIKDVYKKYQKMKLNDLDHDADIVDLPAALSTSANSDVRIVDEWRRDDLIAMFRAFSGHEAHLYDDMPSTVPVYEHKDMPGRILSVYKTFFVGLKRSIFTKPALPTTRRYPRRVHTSPPLFFHPLL